MPAKRKTSGRKRAGSKRSRQSAEHDDGSSAEPASLVSAVVDESIKRKLVTVPATESVAVPVDNIVQEHFQTQPSTSSTIEDCYVEQPTNVITHPYLPAGVPHTSSLDMVRRIIQHLLLYATLRAIVLAHEILLEPSFAEVREFDSINLTCSHSSHFDFMVLKSINKYNVKSTSTIYFKNCIGEGPIVDVESYDFYCIDSKTVIVTLKSVQRSRHMEHFICNSVLTTSESISSNEAILYVTIPVSNIVLQNESTTPISTVEWTETVFVCITKHVFPAPDILWYANDAVLSNGSILNTSIFQVATTNEYPRSYMSVLRMFPKRFDPFTIINCTANNTNDRRISRWVRMLVYCSPRPNQNMSLQSDFASSLFVHKTISFEINAFPEPGLDGFTWQKWDNATSWINLHNDDSTSISTSGLQSNLTLTNITQHSFGKYRLNVTNNVGLYMHEFVLSPNDKPRPPTHFHSIEALTTDSSVCVSWRPGFDGGHSQTFILDYRKLESNNDWSTLTILDSEENAMNTTVSSLTSGTVYEFKMISTNEKGNSSAVGIVTMKTKELGEVNSSTGRLFVSAMSGGIFSVLAIIVVFVGIVVYQKRIVSSSIANEQPECSTVQLPIHVIYENLKIDQIPDESRNCQRGAANNRTSETNVDHTYEGLSREDNGKENENTQVGNDNNDDRKQTYQNLRYNFDLAS